jgi:hypothetical protein
MSAPQGVDVLASRAQEILRERHNDGSPIDRENLAIRIARMEQRESAQAEVIADLRSQCVRNLELGAYGVGYWEDALETIDAALSRIGSAK